VSYTEQYKLCVVHMFVEASTHVRASPWQSTLLQHAKTGRLSMVSAAHPKPPLHFTGAAARGLNLACCDGVSTKGHTNVAVDVSAEPRIIRLPSKQCIVMDLRGVGDDSLGHFDVLGGKDDGRPRGLPNDVGGRHKDLESGDGRQTRMSPKTVMSRELAEAANVGRKIIKDKHGTPRGSHSSPQGS